MPERECHYHVCNSSTRIGNIRVEGGKRPTISENVFCFTNIHHIKALMVLFNSLHSILATLFVKQRLTHILTCHSKNYFYQSMGFLPHPMGQKAHIRGAKGPY